MKSVHVVHAIVDDVQIVAVLRAGKVTVLTNLAGRLSEVGKGTWDGARFECKAWLGRDEEHHAMVEGAIQAALAEAARPGAVAAADELLPART
jgi:hypothetical protein